MGSKRKLPSRLQPWHNHVMETMKKHKGSGKSFKQILKIAKKTYKKGSSSKSVSKKVKVPRTVDININIKKKKRTKKAKKKKASRKKKNSSRWF